MKSFSRISLGLAAMAAMCTASLTASAQAPAAPEPNSVDELVELAEHVKYQDPARYAVMKPEVDRIVRNKRIATAGLVGVAVGGALAAFAGQSAESDQARCDDSTAEASYERADCYRDSTNRNATYVYLGGGLVVTGLIAYFASSPSKEEIREAARNAWTPPVRVGIHVNREGNGAVAGVTGSF